MEQTKKMIQKRREWKMKKGKMNNKGFSLVELIIVIAIMAILMGALAPALMKYLEKSRVSNDGQTAKSIANAVEAALAIEEVNNEIPTGKTFVYYEPTNGLTVDGAFADEVEGAVNPAKVKIAASKTYGTGAKYIVRIDTDNNTVECFPCTSDGKDKTGGTEDYTATYSQLVIQTP